MKVQRNNLSAGRVELVIEIETEAMIEYAKKAATKISETTTIEGFRPGKAPYEMVKTRVGEMVILEEASRLAVSKSIDQAVKEYVPEDWVGQPEITVTKLAPENPFEYRALITLLPKVELGQYKDLKIQSEEIKVADAEVEKMIDQLREVRVAEAAVDRASEIGDKVIADVRLFLDKVPVEGGQANELAIILGKDYFVAGFDEKIVGMKISDTREFLLTYPAEHHQKNLAGKKVEFSVTVKQVYSRELPVVDESFVSAFGLKNLEELKHNITLSIEQEKKAEAAHAFEKKMLTEIISNATIEELPDSLIGQEAHTMLHELEHNVMRSGGKFDEYLQSIGKSKTQLLEEFKPQAVERVQAALVLRSIIQVEKVEVSDDDVKQELENLKKQYAHDQKTVENLSSPAYYRHLMNVLLNRRVLEKLTEWNSLKKDKESV